MDENKRILEVATDFGVDPYFVQAIRKAENGPAGCEFGVQSVKAEGFEAQLAVTCVSVRNHLYLRFPAEGFPLWRRIVGRLCYSPAFIKSFGARWCPPHVHPLNKNWVSNVEAIYRGLVG